MVGLLLRAVSWAGTIALGWLGADWFNERQTSKQAGAIASEPVIIQNTVKKNWLKWVAGGVGLAVGYLLLHKIFTKNK